MAKWDGMLRPCLSESVSFLRRIRFAARSAGTKDAVCHDEYTSDHADGSNNRATLDSGDSADEAILARTLCHGDNTEPPVSSLHAFTQHARLCPNARNSQKRKYTCESDFTVQAPAAALKRTPYITPHVVTGL
jgi:hypothetical protein